MDMTVTQIGAVVVAELRAAGYVESTVAQYAKTIRALSEFASQRVSSVGLGAEFASRTISQRTGRFSMQRRFDYRRLVAVFDSYVQTGRVDLSVRGRGGGGPRPGASGLVALDAAWEAEMDRRDLAPDEQHPVSARFRRLPGERGEDRPCLGFGEVLDGPPGVSGCLEGLCCLIERDESEVFVRCVGQECLDRAETQILYRVLFGGRASSRDSLTATASRTRHTPRWSSA